VVERVSDLVGDDGRRRTLSAAIREYKRTNSFERVGAEHFRIYRHVRNGTYLNSRA